MAAEILIKQGLDLPMEGGPRTSQRVVQEQATQSVFPSEAYPTTKWKLLVKEGDPVKRGSALAHSKRNNDQKLCSPASGTVKAVILGERRSLKEIVIDVDGKDEGEIFTSFGADDLLAADASAIIDVLLATGLITLVKQRPFDVVADVSRAPKSIFVNAMASAPFRPDAHVLVQGKESAFQAGLNALTRLTDGPVHLCVAEDKKDANDGITNASNVQIATFAGPHPAGNTSTHIHALDPILPEDTVWTLRAGDVIRIGELLLTGQYPGTTKLLLAGNGVQESSRGYVTVPVGAKISVVTNGVLGDGEQRIIRGDALNGEAVTAEQGVLLEDSGFVVLPEDRERHLMGWYAPTTTQYSSHRVVPANWIKNKLFTFGTSNRGSYRAMVFTGILDKYVPLDIMVDYLTRACIAKDTDEMIQLGILESAPEDFALCTFVCPSKTDYGQIIGDGLDLIQKEGL